MIVPNFKLISRFEYFPFHRQHFACHQRMQLYSCGPQVCRLYKLLEIENHSVERHLYYTYTTNQWKMFDNAVPSL